MVKTICLIGNPNCGKTSLFNALTGSYQKVGNWSGVTVEKKIGLYKHDKSIQIIDMPGIYTLNPSSDDEKVVVNYLNNNKPDLIINVVDGTNLQRNLYLTAELKRFGIPILLAVNFCDELRKNNIIVNKHKLEKFFRVTCQEISAKKSINLDKLMKLALSTKDNIKPYSDKTIIERNNIDAHINDFINKTETKSDFITQKIDNIIINKYLAFPIFIIIIFLVYFLSSKIGGFFSAKIDVFFDNFYNVTISSMNNAHLPRWLISLYTSIIFKGVCSVLTFAPQVLVLFTFMTIIEESGYATRITFIFDRLVRGIGLGGKSVIPIILSCGCSINGVLSTKTIESDTERESTIYLIPFMPCGAKMAVFGWFSYTFFNGSPFVSIFMYLISVLATVVFGYFLNVFKKKIKKESVFVVEMPTLRVPSIKNILYALWEKLKDFIYKAGTIICAVSIVLWVFSNFGIYGYTENIENSFLYYVGSLIKYLFYPLGFGNWQASVSVLTGIFAKESVIETFSLLNVDYSTLFANKYSILSFMVFVLLSPPCAATISCARCQLKSKKKVVYMLLFQTVCAYIFSLLIVAIGYISKIKYCLLFSLFAVIIILSIVIMIKKRKSCKNKAIDKT